MELKHLLRRIRSATKTIGGAGALLVPVICGQAAALNLASDVWPPFTDEPENTRIALEIVHTALGRANIEAKTDIREFGDLMDALRAGRIDGSAALWRDDDRESFLLFSEPYLENRLVLVGAKGSDASATGFAALEGKTIALVSSYSYGIAEDLAGPQFVRGASLQANLDGLLAGRVDYMLVDELVIQHLLQRFPEKTEELLSVGSTPLVTRPLYFAIRRGIENAEQLLSTFNARIREMQADGTYNQILKLNSIRVDVDGDGMSEIVLAKKDAGTTAPSHGYNLFDYKNKAPAADGENQTYVVGGTSFSQWDEVPDDYGRYDSRFETPTEPDGPLFKLQF